MNTALTSSPTRHDGTLTSLSQLFTHSINGTQVKAIEIPLFQRDYAQGRQSEQACQVRERFLADLCAALRTGKPLHLDFVFGDVVNGTLYPLDGQQRLTTLFLLHCYLGWQQPQDGTSTQRPWHAFHYATRPGARAFCQFLTSNKCRPDMAADTLSGWLCDQADYLPTWKHDPTIQGMLVMLDALHAHYRDQTTDLLRTAWERLIDPANPAICFLLLPVPAPRQNNTLYIKMNSRGRSLTAFENFKANLEALLHKRFGKGDAAVNAFSRKIDADWADLFWQYRGGNNLIDEEFMRYLRFLFEVRTWWRNLPVQTSDSDPKALTALAESLLGSTAPDARADFEWIVQALDIWLEDGADDVRKPKAITTLFGNLFSRQALGTAVPLRIFNFRDFDENTVGTDLFHACCMLYGPQRPWSLAHTVLLYGVLQGLMQKTPLSDLHTRLRLLRNLIEASRSEIRADNTRNNMPALMREVDIIMAGGPLTEVKTFNQVQVRNEQAKQALVAAHPTLQDAVHRLEDHELLRGGLTAFDLNQAQDVALFANRATQFAVLFTHPYQVVSAALLTKGNAGRGYERDSNYRLAFLGAPRQRQAGLWEDHWRIRSNEPVHPSADALMRLLDDMVAGLTPQQVIDAFVAAPGTAKDWRYYLAQYEVMRGENLEFGGTYLVAPDPGYGICLPKTDSCDNRSNHHDGYLLALVQATALAPKRIGNEGWPRCFPGYETNDRWLILKQSGLKVRCVNEGWYWDTTGLDVAQLSAFAQIAGQFNTQGTLGSPYQWVSLVAQRDGIDTEDRIVKVAGVVNALLAAGM